jgi:hypothetical protein
MVKRNGIRSLLLVLPFLTAFTLPAGISLSYGTSISERTFDPSPLIMQAYTNDFGDAPASYGSVDHLMDGRRYLGGEPDGEASQQYSDEANGDDLNGRDDEDGIKIPDLVQGAKATIQYAVVTPALTAVYFSAWFDWNGDGDFNDSGERVANNVSRSLSNTYNLDITVPVDAIGSKPTFARFRLGPRVNTPTGTASSGEVEDYIVKIACVNPGAPRIGTVTQPGCDVATGSVALEGLPTTGIWTLTRYPDGTTVTGSGSTYTVTGLAPGTWSFTVTNQSGCTSSLSDQVVINQAPVKPEAPVIDAVIQPTCDTQTGSISLSGLPSDGNWIVRIPADRAITVTAQP